MNCAYCGRTHFHDSCPSCGAPSNKPSTEVLDIISTGKGPDLVYRDMSPSTGVTALKIAGGGPGDQQTTDLCYWKIPNKENQA